MSLGKLYTYPNNHRAKKVYIAAAYNGETVTEEIVNLRSPEWKQKFSDVSGKVPLFETTKGELIFESNALAYYAAASKPNSPLLSANAIEAAQIQQWLAYSDNEILNATFPAVYMMFGVTPFNQESLNSCEQKLARSFGFIDSYLLTRTFLVADRITLADIVVGCTIAGMTPFFLGADERKQYPNILRYIATLMNQEHFAKFYPDFMSTLPETKTDIKKAAMAAKAERAKAEGKTEKPKADKPKTEKPKPAKEEPEPDYSDPKPKEKNPLDILPPSSFVLDEWKRTYSNNDTRPVAVDWFWKNFDAAGYSMYKVSYKYNDELTLTFMSSNLIGGFYQRLERARKYAFGSMLVLGEDNKNVIQGYFVFRGDGVPFEVSDAADYESYNFKKVDTSDAAVREEFNAYIAWDETIEGMKMCDGKVFK